MAIRDGVVLETPLAAALRIGLVLDPDDHQRREVVVGVRIARQVMNGDSARSR
jgi:hypothetical protein